jgi:hypothetical protein
MSALEIRRQAALSATRFKPSLRTLQNWLQIETPRESVCQTLKSRKNHSDSAQDGGHHGQSWQHTTTPNSPACRDRGRRSHHREPRGHSGYHGSVSQSVEQRRADRSNPGGTGDFAAVAASGRFGGPGQSEHLRAATAAAGRPAYAGSGTSRCSGPAAPTGSGRSGSYARASAVRTAATAIGPVRAATAAPTRLLR